MAESNVAVLCRAGGGEVDVFAWSYECNLTLLAYLYCIRYVVAVIMRRRFPCAYESTVVVGIVGVVNEVVAGAVVHHVATQTVSIAVWSCSLDCLEVRTQLVYRERPVKNRVPVEALVCS